MKTIGWYDLGWTVRTENTLLFAPDTNSSDRNSFAINPRRINYSADGERDGSDVSRSIVILKVKRYGPPSSIGKDCPPFAHPSQHKHDLADREFLSVRVD